MRERMDKSRALEILEKIEEHYNLFNTRYYVDDLPKYFNTTIDELLAFILNNGYHEKVKDVYSYYYYFILDGVKAKIFI